MKKFIYILENNDPQHGALLELTELGELKDIFIGDDYHNKICEKVEGFIGCLELYQLEHLICEIEVDELDSDAFYREDFSINNGSIYLGDEKIGQLVF